MAKADKPVDQTLTSERLAAAPTIFTADLRTSLLFSDCILRNSKDFGGF
jgi:hypothetical protein